MLELKDHVDYNDIVLAAVELCEFVIKKYDIKTMEDWQCPYFKALANQMFMEVEDANG